MSKSKQDNFLALYEPIHNRFERFCRARAYGDMDYKDLMNETLLVAYQKMDSLKSEHSFLSFLFGISVRLLANNNRKLKESSYEDNQQVYGFLDVKNQTETDAEVYLLHQTLAQLPNEQREAIILFEISGFSIKEIAKIEEASESAIKQRLKRGREKLTELLTFKSNYINTKEVKNG